MYAKCYSSLFCRNRYILLFLCQGRLCYKEHKVFIINLDPLCFAGKNSLGSRQSDLKMPLRYQYILEPFPDKTSLKFLLYLIFPMNKE